jgi:predicted dehydrogenase
VIINIKVVVDMKIVRMALIGLGSMGKKYAQMLSDGTVKGVALTAVVCRSEENRLWAKEHLGDKVRVFNNSDELYGQPEQYDAVLIVTPHKSHPQLAIQAFQLGKHVFCDKPAGISVIQAKEMVDAAIASGCLYGMMFHQRMYKKYIRIKELIESGQLGHITRAMMVNARYFRTVHYHQSQNWRSSWTGEGGGALINQGQHILDIWQWLLGMPTEIYANIPYGKYNDFLVDDEATITMKYPNHMTGVFMLTTGEAVWEERFEIIGTKGTIVLEDDTLTFTSYSHEITEYAKTADTNSREGLQFTKQTQTFTKEEEPYPQMFEQFIDAINNGKKPTATGQDGLMALELTNGAYLSAWKNAPITLPIHAEEYAAWLEQMEQREK